MAGEGDTERLIVLLEARLTDFERNMLKAAGVSQKNFNAIKKESKSATRQMEQDMVRSTNRINQALASTSSKIGSFGKAFAGGLLGGVAAGGIAGIALQIGKVANGIAEIGDKARMAGLSNKAFQELAYVAKANRIEVDALTDGMKELALRADEYIATGKGSAAEAFQRLGYSAEDLKKKLKDPSELLLEIIGRVSQLDKAAQIRIFDEIAGGTGGEKLVQLIEQGEAGIRSTIREAHNLGDVLSDDVIEQAAELDRKFNAVATTVSSALKKAIVEASGALGDFIDRFYRFEARRDESLKAEARALSGERLSIEGEMVGLRNMKPGEMVDDGIIFGIGASTPLEKLQELESRLYEINVQEAQINSILEERQKLREAENQTVSKGGDTPPIKPPPGTGRGGGGRDKEAAQAERQAEAVRRLIAELEEELRLVGESDTQKKISAALRRANVDAASKEGQQIAQLVTQIEAETAALEKQKEAQEARTEALSNLFDMGTNALTSIADGSVKASDAVKKLAIELALAAAQAALLGTGPLAGLFGGGGGLFGGGAGAVDPWAGLRLAGGGEVNGPGTSTSDSIPAMLSDGEFVVNAKATKKHRGLLEQINSDSLLGFKDGGLASLPLPGGGVCGVPQSFGEVLA